MSGLHCLLALAARSPRLNVSPYEAQALASATVGVARWYMPVNVVAGPGAAWMALAGVAAMVYGPMVIDLMRGDRPAPAPGLNGAINPMTPPEVANGQAVNSSELVN